MTFVDTNILIDVWQNDPDWGDWSAERLIDTVSNGDGEINAIVLAEISRDFATLPDAEAALSALGLTLVPLDSDTAHLAGQRFAAFRRERERGCGSRVLADFLIGAHAATREVPLLTRDPTAFRRYFPELTLITPETHP